MATEYTIDGYVDFRFVDQLVTNGATPGPYVRFPEMIVYRAQPDVPSAERMFKKITIVVTDHSDDHAR